MQTEPLCHICDNFWFNSSKDLIRQNVCKDLPVSHRVGNNSYCVLHYPKLNKHISTDFHYVLSERLTNKEFDFSYVYFPYEFMFYTRNITSPVRFWFAVFCENADFNNVTFKEEIDFRFATFYKEVNFNKAKFEKYTIFSNAIFKKDVNLNTTEFNSVTFEKAVFESNVWGSNSRYLELANFSGSEFLENAYFGSSKFIGTANYQNAIFNKNIVFSNTIFKNQSWFYFATFFGNGEFSGAKFFDDVNLSLIKVKAEGQLIFDKTCFYKLCSLNNSIIEGFILFKANGRKSGFSFDTSHLEFQNARIDKGERVSFNDIKLHPHWFVNVDVKKFVFHDAQWQNISGNLKEINYEIECLNKKNLSLNSIQSLTITCRQLAINAEESNQYELASRFRRIVMELTFKHKCQEFIDLLLYCFRFLYTFGESRIRYKKHREVFKRWKKRNYQKIKFADFAIILPNYLYKLSSSFGENWLKATVVLLLWLSVFSYIYTKTQFQICPNTQPVSMSLSECKESPENCKCKTGGLSIGEGFTHSIATALFQNVEYRKPLTVWGELLTYLEKIIVPLQAALLALAIRRKFMR